MSNPLGNNIIRKLNLKTGTTKEKTLFSINYMFLLQTFNTNNILNNINKHFLRLNILRKIEMSVCIGTL